MTGIGESAGSGTGSARLNVDDLELELRKLPGVRAAGFTERDDVLLIQLQVSGERPPANLPLQATRIAYRHSEKPVALEVVRWRVSEVAHPPTDGEATTTPATGPEAAAAAEPVAVPEADEMPIPAPYADVAPAPAVALPAQPDERWPRVRLLAVLTFPDTDELEVHLTFGGRRIIGRAVASTGLLAVVEAMVDGLKVFVPDLEYRASWARVIDDDRGRDIHLVACELTAPDDSRRLGIASGASAIEAAARATLHALNRTISQRLAAEAAREAAET